MVLSLLNELGHFTVKPFLSDFLLTLLPLQCMVKFFFHFKYFVFVGKGNYLDKFCGFRETLP